jgi:hypothetical protein
LGVVAIAGYTIEQRWLIRMDKAVKRHAQVYALNASLRFFANPGTGNASKSKPATTKNLQKQSIILKCTRLHFCTEA